MTTPTQTSHSSRTRHQSNEHRHVTFNERPVIFNENDNQNNNENLMSTSLPDLRTYLRNKNLRKRKLKESTKASITFTAISSPRTQSASGSASRSDEPLDDLENTPKQSSIVTIFTVWNAMMGTSVLSMPWGVNQAGPIPATIIMLVMLFICFYSAYLVLKSPKILEKIRRQQVGSSAQMPQIQEFTDICYHLIGKQGHLVAVLSAILAFFGALLVYWILMSGFLYSTGNVFLDILNGNTKNYQPFDSKVICDSESNRTLSAIYDKTWLIGESSKISIWNESTVPIFLAIFMFPLLFIDNIVIFARFNALGTISVCYILCMGVLKLYRVVLD